MKYTPSQTPIPPTHRKSLNEKVLYLIDHGNPAESGISQEDIFNAYTGDGGLHGLKRKDYDSYNAYSDAKKEVENGQFFTPASLCQLVVQSINPSRGSLVADLTCGMGNFFNYLPAESNVYGCELDIKAYKVAHYLYPDANISWEDIRTYTPGVRFDYILGNPPFNLKWVTEEYGKLPSQMYYCMKAASLLKPLGILATIVPESFLSDDFTDGQYIKMMETEYSFLGQVRLPADSFAQLGVTGFSTKLQFWQKKSNVTGWKAKPYVTGCGYEVPSGFDAREHGKHIHEQYVMLAKAALEKNGSQILLELAKASHTSSDFQYQVQKMLYQIQVHPALKEKYPKCCEYLHTFYTQKRPMDMPYETWQRVRLTEGKVLSYLKRALGQQNKQPPRDEIRLVLRNGCLVYKGYSGHSKRLITGSRKEPVPVYQAVLNNIPGQYPGYEKLLRRKRREYDIQNMPFSEMGEDPEIATWLTSLSIWDSENEEEIRLNPIQRHDLNLVIQKRYTLLQWEQGSGKTLAGIATGLYRMQHQHIHSTWVISSAISIRNNWDEVLQNYGIPYIFVEKLSDLKKIKKGDFVIMTLNKLSAIQKHVSKTVRRLNRRIQLVLDESDEISNPSSNRCKAVLACFRRCWGKLLTTGTSTRNNISEFAPQMELLYNNSINMISWNSFVYVHSKEDTDSDAPSREANPYYGKPFPAYKKGYSLFSKSHLPEKITVFGVGQRSQDIYNSDVLNDILAKTVITRTFEEIVGKDIKRIHQVPVEFMPEERAIYQHAIDHFHDMRDRYFRSTGNYRKDAMMRLVQQITLLLRISAAPDSLAEYSGDTPMKILTAVDMVAQMEDEIVAIGVRHKVVLESYRKAIQEYLPDRPLFIVTGDTTFAKRKALRKTLRESKNGILLCTQQSLPSSVNFEFVNKVIIPELHYNNSAMSQFYFRFIRYTSTNFKDIYFLTYAGSIESNQMQMVLAKEKINLFMKGQDVDLDAVYDKFGVDYDLLSILMYREQDENGRFHIRWGQQKIA